MPERSLEAFDFKGLKPQTILILIVLLILFIVSWGSFAIVPAGHRGVVLWWGSVEKRIMGEGLNFKVPIAERVIKVDVKVQPHPFKEIDASSKEYQMVKMTGMMNFHIDPAYVNDLYQKVGLDFADKVIDPAFNDFVKEVVPTYPIGEILPKREEIRQRAMKSWEITCRGITSSSMTSTLPTSDSLVNMKGPSRPSKWHSNRWRLRDRF